MNLLIGILVLIFVCFIHIRRAGGEWPEYIEENHAFVKFTDDNTFRNIRMKDFSMFQVPIWLRPLLHRGPVKLYPQLFVRLDAETHLLFSAGRETNNHYEPKLVEIHYKKGNLDYYYSAENFQMHNFPPLYYQYSENRMPPLYHVFVAIPNQSIIFAAPLRVDDAATRQARVRESRAVDMDNTSHSSSKRPRSTDETPGANTRRRQF